MFFRFNAITKNFGCYATREEAFSPAGSPGLVFGSEEELLSQEGIATIDMVGIFNQVSKDQVQRFSDRRAAARRTWAALEQAYSDAPVGQGDDEPAVDTVAPDDELTTVEEASVVEGVAVPAEVVADEPKARGRRTGTGEFSGTTIFPLSVKNPRRIGTFGFKSYEIIREAVDGMAYSDYVAAGGRPQDLRWDVKHGWARLGG